MGNDSRSTIIIVVAAACIVLLPLVIRWVLSRLFDAGVDAIKHKVNEKKNAESAGNSQNLADLYGQVAPQAPVESTPSKETKLFCRHCGEQLTDGTVFCSKCGTRVE